jgi:hypothetical protein
MRSKFRVRKIKDLTPLKPGKFQDYLTLLELAREVERDPSWLRRLERRGSIPEAHRVPRGQLMIRLYSPAQVNEIKAILKTIKPGRPPKVRNDGG